MTEVISISGTLLMLDDTTPHVAVPVQACLLSPPGREARGEEGKVIATVLSDQEGKYRFINLKPGRYQVRCQILNGYVYYEKGGNGRKQGYDDVENTDSSSLGDLLQVERDRLLENIDFRFAPFKKGTWRNYDTLDGLPANAVTDIYRDSDGVMWFATDGGGVSRYDGKEFANFTTKDGLAHNVVTDIDCFVPRNDSDGVIFFATVGGGVSRYDGKEFVNFTTKDGLVNNKVLSIYCGPSGVMWLGTVSGVSQYDGKKFVNFTTKDGLVNNYVNAIHRTPDGAMWFGTGHPMHSPQGGVSRYDEKEFVNFTKEDGLASNVVWSICGAPNGVIWFGTEEGVSRCDGEKFTNFTEKDGLVNNVVWDIHCDADGVMWFATEGGISRYDGKTLVNFTEKDGLSNNWINAIHRTPDDAMWFGTGNTIHAQRGGVSRYDQKGFVSFTRKDGLGSNFIWTICGHPDGTIWFGTQDGGASQYDGKEFQSFTEKDGLTNDKVHDIYCDADGMMWFATDLGGVSRYDGKKFVNFTTKDGLASNIVWSIHGDPDGMIWFGTFAGGVSRYDGNQFLTFTEKDGLVDNTIYVIYGEPDGVIWFGSAAGLWGAGGVSRYDGRKFDNFTTEDGLADNNVFSIYRDPDGIIWFGTYGGGVSRYDGKGFVNLTVEDGLAHNLIVDIYRDSDGNMWFGTDGGGVSCYNGVAWTSLDKRDGLAGKCVYSIYQDSEGFMWFGTEGGITRYRPSTTLPKVYIVSITAEQKYFDLSNIPAFTSGTRVTIEYNAIDFRTIPGKRQYRCRIKGINSGWRNPTKSTSFDYTFDQPGNYTFEVQAIDRDLNYSEPATLSLTIEPDPVLVSMRTELNHLRREVRGKYHFENIIGRSAAIRQVHAFMESAIDSGLTVLITGETGTGKELVAKAIHYNSTRKDQPLMDRNCGAIPKELLASELFGHRKGAFTGAQEDKVGLFEAASGGTVLLDEISEMPLDAQVHLLRVLQERQVQRLGENVSRDVDVRIIAMTNKDLIEEGKAGRFREDLYYRLTEFPIHIPPLRERPEDIPLLAEHFLQEYSQEQKKQLDGFAPGVFEMLQSYAWPGNVRELRNDIRRAAALVEDDERIHLHHFSPKITQELLPLQEAMPTIGPKSTRYRELVDGFERKCIEHALRVCNGNRSQAATMLGLGRKSLYEKMQRLGIDISTLLPEK
ncbi:hypothetical protein FJZ31_32165 [Candidatus Poribacteria bacterium]|nr:hypothetical protein [Candidatus Poribacteria bacterium]